MQYTESSPYHTSGYDETEQATTTNTAPLESGHVPEGYEVDHHCPDAFVVRCPDCGRRHKTSSRPGREERVCGPCNRLQGVTPVSKTEDETTAEDGPRLVTDGSGFVWDHADCPEAYCEGELQQQDQFNVMCLDCRTIWTHYKDEKQHELVTPDHEVVATKPRAIADGGTHAPALREPTFVDLTGFQRDVLWVLSHEGRSKGTAIRAHLEDYYGVEVTTSRLYPNLDELTDLGLVEKGRRDRRTNEYSLTEQARQALSNRQAWEWGEGR